MRIEAVDLHAAGARDLVGGLHAVNVAAYAQEARLLGFADVNDFPPLQRSIESLQESDERFIIAFDGDAIVGAIGIEPAASAHDSMGPRWAGEPLPAGEAHIASLAVLPSHQRRGIARGLLTAALAAHAPHAGPAGAPITVSTSELNLPALSLYGQFGFTPWRKKRISWQSPRTRNPHTLDLVLLRRA